jgi:hypothetical protein
MNATLRIFIAALVLGAAPVAGAQSSGSGAGDEGDPSVSGVNIQGSTPRHAKGDAAAHGRMTRSEAAARHDACASLTGTALRNCRSANPNRDDARKGAVNGATGSDKMRGGGAPNAGARNGGGPGASGGASGASRDANGG